MATKTGMEDYNPDRKKAWMSDHHKSQITGSVASAAPYGTSDVNMDYATSSRPATAQAGAAPRTAPKGGPRSTE